MCTGGKNDTIFVFKEKKAIIRMKFCNLLVVEENCAMYRA
jgi:hypothetical protein